MGDRPRPGTKTKAGTAIGAARRQNIIGLLSTNDTIAVADLATRFQASPETIRRDVRSLEQEGLLHRVHGGVQPIRVIDLTARRPIVERLDIDRDAKKQAALAALPLFSDGMTIFMDGGSTLLFLAEAIANSGVSLSVTTHMINVATIMANSPNCSVTLIGGVVNRKNHSVGGLEVIRSLEGRLFDLAVMGSSALNFDHGFLGPSRSHVELSLVLQERSSAIACVMHRGKIGSTDAHIMLPLNLVTWLATDGQPLPEHRRQLEKNDIQILTPPKSTNDMVGRTEQ